MEVPLWTWVGFIAFVLAMLNIISSRYRTSDMDEVDGLKN